MDVRTQLDAGDVAVGAVLGELGVRPTHVTMFRFSAATWNPHRVHNEAAYAATKSCPDVLVHPHLHGCWLAQLVTEWAGPKTRVAEFIWQNRHFAVPGDVLRCSGVVIDVRDEFAECRLQVVNQQGRNAFQVLLSCSYHPVTEDHNERQSGPPTGDPGTGP